jgi:hypothetical protein
LPGSRNDAALLNGAGWGTGRSGGGLTLDGVDDVDDVRLFTRALSASEVAALASGP